MTHTILVGIDTRELADGGHIALLAEVRRLAHALGSEVVLLHLAEADPTFMGFDADTDTMRNERAQRERADHRAVQALAAELREADIEARALQFRGPPADALADRADQLHADLIAIEAHQRGPLMRALLGSVSHRLVDHAPCPVLVVPRVERG